MSREAVAVLVKARGYVEQGWVQHTGRMGDRRCAGQAIDDALHDLDKYGTHDTVRWEVMETFHQVIGIYNIPNWNDDACRTKTQVLIAFDKAIALLTPPEAGEKVVVPRVDAELAAIIDQANTKIEYQVIPVEAPGVSMKQKVLDLLGV